MELPTYKKLGMSSNEYIEMNENSPDSLVMTDT